MDMVAAAIRTIFAQPDADAVDAQFDRIVATLEPQFPTSPGCSTTPATICSRSPRSRSSTGARSGRPTRCATRRHMTVRR